MRWSKVLSVAIGAAAGAAVGFAPGAAQADPASDAAKIFQEADAAASKKDWATCVAKAEQAWATFQHAQIRGLQGKCELEMGKYREAAIHISFYEKTSTSGVEPDFLDALKKAKEHVEELTITNPKAGATVSVDGVELGPAPVTLFVDPGKHVVDVKLGADSVKKEIDAVAGTKVTVDVPFEVVIPPPPSARPIWPGALLVGLGGGLVVAGAVTAGLANASTDVRCGGTACPEGDEYEQTQADLSNASLWTFMSGGVLVAAGIPLLVWAATGPKPLPVAVVPIVSPTFGGASFRANF